MTKPTILVVEDESVIAASIAETLKESGYKVCAMTSSGEDAIRDARQHHPDLVLMDIYLAGEMDGLSAAAQIHASLGIPVVYLTAHTDQDTLDRAKVTMPYGYLVKPFKESELRAAVELALYRANSEKPKGQTKGGHSAIPQEELSPEKAKVQDLLRQNKFFSTLSEATIALVARNSREESFRTNYQIVIEGDEAVAGFLVLSGRVALVKSSESGRELVVELLSPGDPLGLVTTVNTKYYPFTFRAQIKSSVLWIRRSHILLMFDECPDLSRTLLKDLFVRLGRSHDMSS